MFDPYLMETISSNCFRSSDQIPSSIVSCGSKS